MGTSDCPSEQELAAFNLGDLPEASLEAISRHLESCPSCGAFLDSLDGRTDSAIASLRYPGSARDLGRIGALTAGRSRWNFSIPAATARKTSCTTSSASAPVTCQRAHQ